MGWWWGWGLEEEGEGWVEEREVEWWEVWWEPWDGGRRWEEEEGG